MIDLVIVGGGILGIATALEILQTFPGLEIQILEKESGPAKHQTGRNSGVLHAGIYYTPGSLKAEFCREGRKATIRFCQEYGIPFEQTGKLLVATNETEELNLKALSKRALTNGLNVRNVSKEELKELEPNITGSSALLSPETGIVDYSVVCTKMIEIFKSKGGEITYGAKAIGFSEESDRIKITLSNGNEVKTRHLFSCAGMGCDRIAAAFGIASDFAIIPFKGEYYRKR